MNTREVMGVAAAIAALAFPRPVQAAVLTAEDIDEVLDAPVFQDAFMSCLEGIDLPPGMLVKLALDGSGDVRLVDTQPGVDGDVEGCISIALAELRIPRSDMSYVVYWEAVFLATGHIQGQVEMLEAEPSIFFEDEKKTSPEKTPPPDVALIKNVLERPPFRQEIRECFLDADEAVPVPLVLEIKLDNHGTATLKDWRPEEIPLNVRHCLARTVADQFFPDSPYRLLVRWKVEKLGGAKPTTTLKVLESEVRPIWSDRYVSARFYLEKGAVMAVLGGAALLGGLALGFATLPGCVSYLRTREFGWENCTWPAVGALVAGVGAVVFAIGAFWLERGFYRMKAAQWEMTQTASAAPVRFSVDPSGFVLTW